MTQILPTAIISILMLFVIIGFVCGWIRGLNKSLTRFIMVIAVAVLTFFIAAPISKAIVNMDLSKHGWTISGVKVTTVGATVVNLLEKIPKVGELVQASDTFRAFVNAAPQMLVNVVLFIVLFFLIKWFTMIIYWIIAGVCFNKKKMEGKDRHKFIGAVIGALQGFIVAFVIMIPIFGVIATAKPVIDASRKTSEQQVVTVDEQNGNEESELKKAINTSSAYIDGATNSWVYKVFKGIGLQQLSVSMYDHLTTVKEKGKTFELRSEVVTLAKAYPELDYVMTHGFSIEDTECLENVKKAVDTLYGSKVLSGMVKEVIPYAAQRWINNETFMDIKKPVLDTSDPTKTINGEINDLIDAVLAELADAHGDDIKNDITTGLDIMIKINEAQAEIDGGSIVDALGKDGLVSDIVEEALKSGTIKALLPRVVGVGLSYVYDALGIENGEKVDHTVTITDDEWETEKVALQKIFQNLFNLYKDIQDSGEGDPIETFQFGTFGLVLEGMRESKIFDPIAKNLIDKVLDVAGIDVETNQLLGDLVDDLKAAYDDKTVNLSSTFTSLGNAVKIARNLQKSDGQVNPEELGGLLRDLADAYKSGGAEGNPVKDIVDNLTNSDNLQKFGVDEQTAGLVEETIGKVLENAMNSSEEELESDIKAVEELYDVANKVLSSEDQGNVKLDEQEAKDLVDALAGSASVLESVGKAGSAAQGLLDNVFSDEEGDQTKENLKGAIEAVQDEGAKEKLKELFGSLFANN